LPIGFYFLLAFAIIPLGFRSLLEQPTSVLLFCLQAKTKYPLLPPFGLRFESFFIFDERQVMAIPSTFTL
jgi:hypothetical protein